MSAYSRAGATAALVLAISLPVAAQAPAPDPDSAETHAHAKEALSRAERREVKSEVRAIQGLGLAVQGKGQDISGLLRDLNAEVRGREVRIALSADVLFDFDKAELKTEARPALGKVAEVLKSYPKATARIEGHTDGKGDEAYNLKLSQRRADAVREYLAEQGATLRMSTQGWGKKKPAVPNVGADGKDDPEGRRRNRRVEITVQQASTTKP